MRRHPGVVGAVGAALLLASPAPAAATDLADEAVLVSHVPGRPLQTANAPSGGRTSVQPPAPSTVLEISADGRFVVFTSEATDLVEGQVDRPATPDVFLWDRNSGEVVLVSRVAGSAVTAGDDASWNARVSADGAVVLFESFAGNLVGGQVDANGGTSAFPYTTGSDVFLFDRLTGGVSLLSHRASSPTVTGNGESLNARMSSDGAVVVFESKAWDLVGAAAGGTRDTNNAADVFLWERVGGTVRRLSAGDGESGAPSISADGSVIAFASTSSNAIPGLVKANPGQSDVYAVERASGAVTLLSAAAGRPLTTGNGLSYGPRVDPTGRFVSYASSSSNLVQGQVDAAGNFDVLLADRASRTTTLVSHIPASPVTAANGMSIPAGAAPAPSAVAVPFASNATNLVRGQSGPTSPVGPDQALVFRPGTGAVSLVSHPAGSATTTLEYGCLIDQVSADGGLLLTSCNHSLAGSDEGGLFLVDATTGAVSVVSQGGFNGVMTPDSRYLAFVSVAGDVVAGQIEGNDLRPDVFFLDRGVATGPTPAPPPIAEPAGGGQAFSPGAPSRTGGRTAVGLIVGVLVVALAVWFGGRARTRKRASWSRGNS